MRGGAPRQVHQQHTIHTLPVLIEDQEISEATVAGVGGDLLQWYTLQCAVDTRSTAADCAGMDSSHLAGVAELLCSGCQSRQGKGNSEKRRRVRKGPGVCSKWRPGAPPAGPL